MKQLILASGSPRRKKLLAKLNIPFIVVVSNFEEYMDESISPQQLAEALSLGKAQTVADKYPGSIIVAADTFVVHKGKFLGKPKDKAHAKEILKNLSNSRHTIVTGFTIIDSETKKTITDSDTGYLTLNSLLEKQIEEYVENNEVLDKAGGYALQEVPQYFIKKVEGDEDTIIGLPTKKIENILKKYFGY